MFYSYASFGNKHKKSSFAQVLALAYTSPGESRSAIVDQCVQSQQG